MSAHALLDFLVMPSVQSLDDFTANPDMVEEFFYLVGRIVDYCPEPLISRCMSSFTPCDLHFH